MSDTAALTLTVGMLHATFGHHWRIFELGGVWWAVRPGVEKWDGPESLLLRTITAPDLTALADRLCFMDWLDGLDDDSLAAVYRGETLESAP